MRSTPGNSFGPIAISATTAMTTNSLHPMSNIKNSAHAGHFTPILAKQDLGRPRLPQPVLPKSSTLKPQGLAVEISSVQTALLPTSDRAVVDGAALWSIDFTGSGFSAV